jgi:hypothetical protein
MTHSLLVVLVVGLPQADDKSWVGQTVMPRKPTVTFGDRGPGEKRADLERKFDHYAVLREQGDWQLLKNGGQEGWGLKVEWVPLADAPAHYSAMIRIDATDTWA